MLQNHTVVQVQDYNYHNKNNVGIWELIFVYFHCLYLGTLSSDLEPQLESNSLLSRNMPITTSCNLEDELAKKKNILL